MESKINEFISYLHNVRRVSINTEQSYKRDLLKMQVFFESKGITKVEEITNEGLKDYIKNLENNNFAPTTVSRNIAAIKTWFVFMKEDGSIKEDVSKTLQAPKIEKKFPDILSVREVKKILKQPQGNRPKEIRDRAMLVVLYETGIRVSQLTTLLLDDIDLDKKSIICRNGNKWKELKITKNMTKSIGEYLDCARGKILGEKESKYLFVNCAGNDMSRQGFWKILKNYVKKAAIKKEITPHTLRHSLAVHSLEKGMTLQEVKKLLGNADITSMQVYQEIYKANRNN